MPSDEERFKLLDRAHEIGCVHWDSAALYGDSEDLLGKWFERTGKRKDVSCRPLKTNWTNQCAYGTDRLTAECVN